MDKKILLVKIDDPEEHHRFPPFGFMYIADSLKKKGYRPKILHKAWSGEFLEEIKKEAQDSFLICFSVITAPSIRQSLEATKTVKDMGKITVWGGLHPTILPETTLKDEFIDYVILREGEETLPRLIQALETDGNVDELEGIGYRKGHKTIVKKVSDFTDIDEYNMCWDDINVEEYIFKRDNHPRTLPFMTSRGCPYRCAFCYNVAVNNRRWRGQSVDSIEQDIQQLHKFNLDAVYIFDDYFFVNKKRAFDIVRRMNIPYWAEIRADCFNEEFVKELKETNCFEVFIGAESGSARTLELIHKDATKEQVENAVKLCHQYGIRVTLSFMTAFPYDTEEDRLQNFDFMYYLHKTYDNVNLDGPKVFTPYPGTPLYDIALKHGFEPPQTTREWGEKLARFRCNLPWVPEDQRPLFEKFNLMVQLGQMKKNLITLPIKTLEEYRWKNKNFRFPYELTLFSALKNGFTTKLFFKYLKQY